MYSEGNEGMREIWDIKQCSKKDNKNGGKLVTKPTEE